MREHDIGDVLIVDTDDKLAGIVTDRDLVLRCMAEEKSPADTRIGVVCTGEPIALSPGDDLDKAIATMRQHAVRRLPVVDDGRPVGIVSLGDLAEQRDPESVLGQISAANPN